MKIGISVSVEHSIVKQLERDVRAWGYKNRSEFFAAAYAREKAEREKAAKKAARKAS